MTSDRSCSCPLNGCTAVFCTVALRSVQSPRAPESRTRYWLNPYVEKDKIIGKAFLRYWPLNKISLIE